MNIILICPCSGLGGLTFSRLSFSTENSLGICRRTMNLGNNIRKTLSVRYKRKGGHCFPIKLQDICCCYSLGRSRVFQYQSPNPSCLSAKMREKRWNCRGEQGPWMKNKSRYPTWRVYLGIAGDHITYNPWVVYGNHLGNNYEGDYLPQQYPDELSNL